MSSNINKPTGLGYSSSMQRKCTNCSHTELNHYGKCLYYPACGCKGFSARKLDKEELAALEPSAETKYVGEAWLDEFVSDATKND